MTSPSVIPKVTPLSIPAQVSAALRDAILSGRFKPGDRLVERRLAEEVGVSLASIRNALQQLEHEGLVVKKANTATHVTQLSRKKLEEMHQVRILLEPQAMVLASKNMTEPSMKKLQSAVADIEAAITINDFYGVSHSDLRFHQLIWETSGNETLAKILSQLCTQLFAFVMIMMSVNRENLKARVNSHQALLDVLGTGNAEQVQAAALRHVMTAWHPFLDKL
jgi:DNA-binding GntR family transcriptional regulator